MVLEAIKNFLFEKDIAVIHLIAVAILSPLVFWLLRKLSTAILKAIKKAVRPILKFIAKMNRLRKRKITIRDYQNIDARLKRGDKLRWYEKEAYYKAKKQKEEAFRKLAKGSDLEMPQLPHIKEFPNKQDGGGHDKENA